MSIPSCNLLSAAAITKLDSIMKSIVVLLTLFVATSVHAQSSFSFRETSNTTRELSEGGKPVFVYNYGMVLAPNAPESMRRSGYLHPVYSPDGTVLTDDFNPDHPHIAASPGCGQTFVWMEKRAICGR